MNALTFTGLTESEVRQRVADGQANVFAHKTTRSAWDIIHDNVFTIFNVTLFVAVIATLAAGLATQGARVEVVIDALFAGASVWVNMVVGIVQELLAKRKLDKLAALVVKKARVRRNGADVDVPVDGVVIDDLVVLSPGDRVPVDGAVVGSRALEMDESLLTGESDSISKAVGDPVMSGTFCLAGSGIFKAEKVGAESYANRLTATARGFKNALTPLQLKLNFVVQILVVLMVIVAALQLIAAWNTNVALVDALRYTLVIVTSFVPAGLILANTVSLSVGAVQIARFDTLVQRVNAIESMGNVTVLCTDKTGTLTTNRLKAHTAIPLSGFTDADIRELLAKYVWGAGSQNKTAGAIGQYTGQPAQVPDVVAEVPFSSARKWGALTVASRQSSVVSRQSSVASRTTLEGVMEADRVTLILGSPELVLDAARPDYTAIQLQAAEYTQQALRVLALAVSPGALDGAQVLPELRIPAALVVLSDEIRPDIADTIDKFENQGVRVKVITGDSADTVKAIARRAGIRNDTTTTEMELAAMDKATFDTAVRTHGLFARITPETKQRIVASLSKQGEYVAMVGDGVNDVPALKESRLGVAMNDGAQIAKDVSELVLLNNALSTLPHALKEGQRISQKIYASSRLYLAKNVVTILAFLFVGYVALPFPAEPRQISWIATITVSLPCTLVAFGLLRPGYTRRFQREVLSYSILVGAVGSIILTAAYLLEFAVARNLEAARAVFTMVNLHFSMYVFWDVHDVNVFSLMSIRKHAREALAGLVLLVVGVAVPQLLPRLFNASPLTPSGWLIALLLPVAGAVAMRAAVYGPFTRSMLHALRK